MQSKTKTLSLALGACLALFAVDAAAIKPRVKIDPAEVRRNEELNEVLKRLRGYLDSGKLHRYLEPVAAALLEESAKNWKRVQEALKGPAWAQASLPAVASGSARGPHHTQPH